jgi:hypothetical protein
MIESVKNEALSKVDELIKKIQSLESFTKIKGDKSNAIIVIYRPLEVKNVPVSCLI